MLHSGLWYTCWERVAAAVYNEGLNLTLGLCCTQRFRDTYWERGAGGGVGCGLALQLGYITRTT